MSNGIYIYNVNFIIEKKLYTFNKNEIISNDDDNNKTALAEYKTNNNFYILYLVKKYFLLFNNEKMTIIKSNLNDIISGNLFTLIPYNFYNNNLYFVIVSSIQTQDSCWKNTYSKYYLNIYSIHYNFNTKILYYSQIEYKPSYRCSTYITDKIFSCQIYSQSYLICLYLIDKNKGIEISKFDIKSSFNLIKTKKYSNSAINKIMQIKTCLSTTTNYLLICYYWQYYNYYHYNYKPYTTCLFYYIDQNSFNELFYTSYIQNLENFYNEETKSFNLIINDNQNNIYIYKVNETSLQYNKFYKENFKECIKINNFYLNYNSSRRSYNLISDCYKDNNNWNIIYNNSIFSSFSEESSISIKQNADDEFIIPEVEEMEDEQGILEFNLVIDEVKEFNYNIDDKEEEIFEKEENEKYSFKEEEEEMEEEIKEIEKEEEEIEITIEKEMEEEIEEKELEIENILEEELETEKIKEDIAIYIEKEIEKEIYDNIKEEEEKYDNVIEDEKKENTKIKEIENYLIEERTKEIDFIEQKEIKISKDNIIQNLTELIDNIAIGRNYKYIGEDYNIVIKPTNASYLETETHVNFTQCEKTLRKVLNISESRILTFLQMEIDNKNEKSLVNKVEYQVYDDNKNLLDLSICNDSNIQIFHAIKDNSLLNINTISSFKDSEIDIFNLEDSFFHDICQPYSDSKNDIVLKDRIKDIYQNYSLCDEGCTYNEINTELMTISCNCKVKNSINANETTLNMKKIDEIKTESNFGLIKCYNLVFSFDGKPKNIGFWIFFILAITHIPLLIFYFSKGITPIKHYLLKEMSKYGYITSDKKSINTNVTNKTNDIKKYQYKNSKNYVKRLSIKPKSNIQSPPKPTKIEKNKDSDNNNKIRKKRKQNKKFSNKI